MKALSVRQPYAGLLVNGTKTTELRSWSTAYRGPLAIVSAVAPYRLPEYNEAVARHGEVCARLGVLIGTVEVVDVVQHGPSRFAWVVANPVRAVPTPITGALGLFDISDDAVEPVPAALTGGPTVMIAVRLPDGLLAKLDRIADAATTNRSVVVRRLVMEAPWPE